MRTKKKHLRYLQKKKTRKTSKNRLDAGGLFDSTKENVVSLGKNAIEIASNPLTSLRKGVNYAKNKGKFALTYLVNTSDLDRIVYKNSNFIHLVPTEILNNVYYENKEKKGDSEIAYAAKRTVEVGKQAIKAANDAAITVGTQAREAAIKTKEVLGKLNPVNETTIAAAKSALNGAAIGAVAIGQVAKVAADKGSEVASSIWKTINDKGTFKRQRDTTNGKYETIFAAVGRKADHVQMDLDFDHQPGLTKKPIKKQTIINATYEPSNITKDVLNETLTPITIYSKDATAIDIMNHEIANLEENLALIRNHASTSNKKKRKKGKKQQKQQKQMVFENEISKEQKFEISKGLLEMVYDMIPSDSDSKKVLILLNETNFKKKTFLKNVNSTSDFDAQHNIQYVEEGEGEGTEGGSSRKKKKKQKQKGGAIKLEEDDTLIRDPSELSLTESENSCIIGDGSAGKANNILADLVKIRVENNFSLLFFDINIWEEQSEINMKDIEPIIRDNGIIIGDPIFDFGDWKKRGSFKLKVSDDIYGVFVKNSKDFNPITGIDLEDPPLEEKKEVVNENEVNENEVNENEVNENEVNENEVNENEVNENGEDNNSIVNNQSGNPEINDNTETVSSNPSNNLVGNIEKTAVLILKDILDKHKNGINKSKDVIPNKIVSDQKPIDDNTSTQSDNSSDKKTNVPVLPLSNLNIKNDSPSQPPENNKKPIIDIPIEITTNAIKVGGTNENDGLEIPLTIFKFLRMEGKGKEKGKELLQKMVKPQIIRKRLENTQRFIDILDEIIKNRHCDHLQKNETKIECFKRDVIELSSLLHLDIPTDTSTDSDTKKKIKEYNENKLFQSIVTSSDNSSSSSNINEWYQQEIRSPLFESIIPQTPNNTGRSTISSVTTDSSFPSDDFLGNEKNQNAFIKKIKKLQEEIGKKRKLTSEMITKIKKDNANISEQLELFKVNKKEKGEAEIVVTQNVSNETDKKSKKTKISEKFKNNYNSINIDVKKDELKTVKNKLDNLFKTQEKKTIDDSWFYKPIILKGRLTKKNLTEFNNNLQSDKVNSDSITEVNEYVNNDDDARSITSTDNLGNSRQGSATRPGTASSSISSSNTSSLDLSMEDEVELIVDNIIDETDILLEINSARSSSSSPSTTSVRSEISDEHEPIDSNRFTKI